MEPYGWAVEWTLQQPGIMPDEDGDRQKGKPALKADRNQEVDRCPGHIGVLRGGARCYWPRRTGANHKDR